MRYYSVKDPGIAGINLEELTLLNIPNYYSSYYLFGLSKYADITYRPSAEFKKWNGWPFLILKKGRKIVIIDNADPVCVRQDLYDEAGLYFVTNKLQDNKEYNQPKIRALFPHYPINCWKTYLKIFKKHLFLQLGTERALREIYTLHQRPYYRDHYIERSQKNYIFFVGSIWKKEEEANFARAEFIKASKKLRQIRFEGGLRGRTDGNNYGCEDVLSTRKYKPREFSEKSARSFVSFNNPAVLGAVSWRFAEYLNMGSAVISLPWQIELPDFPEHEREIHMIEDPEEIEEALKYMMENPDYQKKIAKGGKEFFKRSCSPFVQGERIMKVMKK